eukprot:2862155-Rhodomonas_salina.3
MPCTDAAYRAAREPDRIALNSFDWSRCQVHTEIEFRKPTLLYSLTGNCVFLRLNSLVWFTFPGDPGLDASYFPRAMRSLVLLNSLMLQIYRVVPVLTISSMVLRTASTRDSAGDLGVVGSPVLFETLRESGSCFQSFAPPIRMDRSEQSMRVVEQVAPYTPPT